MLILLNSTVHLKPKPTGSSPSPRFSASRNGCILAIPTEGETGDEDGKPIDFWVKSQKKHHEGDRKIEISSCDFGDKTHCHHCHHTSLRDLWHTTTSISASSAVYWGLSKLFLMLAGRNGIAENLWERIERMPQNIRADWAKQVAHFGLPQRQKLHKPFFPTIQDQQDPKKTQLQAQSGNYNVIPYVYGQAFKLGSIFHYSIPSHSHHYPILSLWIN